ncbi:MAG TPA: replication-relaxation family protein [Jatrophihabitans sp.]|uniref:replication-relaxation family protein n=1 Tax=Jatrophihabitans sp. TaxID=1932789 RepID=UPI002F0D205C
MPPERSRPEGPKRTGRGPARRGQRERADRLKAQLSARDLSVLFSLDAHRFLTTEQLIRFHFANHRTPAAAGRICRRVLQRLFDFGLIEHLDRRVGGVRAGSASYVWRAGAVGDQLLRLLADDAGRPRARRKEPSLRWLEHCLLTAEVHLCLLDLARAGRVEVLSVVTEPRCWRRYTPMSGAPETLKPDLLAVTAQAEFEDHWFFEIDRATESLPTLLSKCAQYEDYRRSGQADDVLPLVVWVVPDELHAAKLTAGITASRTLDPALYRVCTLASLPAVISGSPA